MSLLRLAEQAAAWATPAHDREFAAEDVTVRAIFGGDVGVGWVAEVGRFTASGKTSEGALRALVKMLEQRVDLARLVRRTLTEAPIARVREVLDGFMCDDGCCPNVADLDDAEAIDMLYDLALDDRDPLATWHHCQVIR